MAAADNEMISPARVFCGERYHGSLDVLARRGSAAVRQRSPDEEAE